MAIALSSAASIALAQEVTQHFDVPADGYSGTDTFISGDLWNEYVVQVPLGHELVYTVTVQGEGKVGVSLVQGDSPTIYSMAYSAFSSTGEVTSYTARTPADYGFDRAYTILVNSSSAIDVQYTIDVHTEEPDTGNYTLYYVLIIIGFVALVVFSWKFVVWQEEKEKGKSKKEGKRRRR